MVIEKNKYCRMCGEKIKFSFLRARFKQQNSGSYYYCMNCMPKSKINKTLYSLIVPPKKLMSATMQKKMRGKLYPGWQGKFYQKYYSRKDKHIIHSNQIG